MRALLLSTLLPLLLILAIPSQAKAEAGPQPESSSMQKDLKAMHDFNSLHEDETGILKVKKEKQHRILFFMGIGLLIGLLLTAAFGVAMVLGGKQVFLWHMLFAGVTITLALAHAVTSIVWFYPF